MIRNTSVRSTPSNSHPVPFNRSRLRLPARDFFVPSARHSSRPDAVRTTFAKIAQGESPMCIHFLPDLSNAKYIGDHYTPRIADIVELVDTYPSIFAPLLLPRVIGVVRLVDGGFTAARLEHSIALGQSLDTMRYGKTRGDEAVHAYPLTIDVSALGGDPEKIAQLLRSLQHNFTSICIDPLSPYAKTRDVVGLLGTSVETSIPTAVDRHLRTKPNFENILPRLVKEIDHVADLISANEGETRSKTRIIEDLNRLIPLYVGGRLGFEDHLARWDIQGLTGSQWGKTISDQLKAIGLDSPQGKQFVKTLFNLVFGDGTSILGLSARKKRPVIGAVPTNVVNNGKSGLISSFGGISSFHLSFPPTLSPQDIINYALAIAPGHSSYNQEDITNDGDRAAIIYKGINSKRVIFNFADDMYGTAIVTGAALLNAAKIFGKRLEEMTVRIVGAGAAGSAIAEHLLRMGVRPENLVVCDSKGGLHNGRSDLTPGSTKAWLAAHTNTGGLTGSLEDLLRGADAVVGVSVPGAIQPQWINNMAPHRAVFLTANPIPECDLEKLDRNGEGTCQVALFATGKKYDVANSKHSVVGQINNIKAFPGMLAAATMDGLTHHEIELNIAASYAIARTISAERLAAGNVSPPYVEVQNRQVHVAVRQAVSDTARLN